MAEETETEAEAEAELDARVDHEAVGRTYLDDRPWEFITALTALGSRMGGSEGERRAADVVAEAFAEAGVRDVGLDPFETRAWTRGTSSLELLDPVEREYEALALPYAPAATVEGELVDVGYGTPAEVDEVDVEGAIAVASTTTPPGGRFVHRMEKFGHAYDAGAVGFVFVNHVPGQLPPTGSLRFGEEAPAPAVGVSKESGGWLREYADRGGRARLSVEASTEPGESQNVVGRLGPETDTEVLLVGHYDAHDVAEGALDNGCGVAVVATAARVLAASDLPLGVRVAALGCEETGLAGGEHLAETADLERVAGVVNVDGAGRHRDLRALTQTSEAIGAAAEAVGEYARHPVGVEPEPHPYSDQWPFVRRGVPGVQLQSDSGERGRGWGHTQADTRDKVDDRNIRDHGVLAALLVLELGARAAAGDGRLPRLDRGTLQSAFRERDFETGMRAAGLWPAAWDDADDAGD
jgi:Zn-dependent M28 family amino/carboxypeptidase